MTNEPSAVETTASAGPSGAGAGEGARTRKSSSALLIPFSLLDETLPLKESPVHLGAVAQARLRHPLDGARRDARREGRRLQGIAGLMVSHEEARREDVSGARRVDFGARQAGDVLHSVSRMESHPPPATGQGDDGHELPKARNLGLGIRHVLLGEEED